ncbi:hypothetical protein SmJEL517_g01545 [Synchytrium microbalum]|uniref:Dynein heavy chain, cytoplasmic n=1 Tax=Synchytrium microbalum TaxID=1806994 RepID=A0A507CA59_9FUNG|nr:uncharacterized protein SmJEL517_g01545 [Synchytrium microbalum]TPX36228.1 hypothetical protein SmJEL517_g01545 [Synchytrium microbalum]
MDRKRSEAGRDGLSQRWYQPVQRNWQWHRPSSSSPQDLVDGAPDANKRQRLSPAEKSGPLSPLPGDSNARRLKKLPELGHGASPGILGSAVAALPSIQPRGDKGVALAAEPVTKRQNVGASFTEATMEVDVQTDVYELIQNLLKTPSSPVFAYAITKSDATDFLYNPYRLKLIPYRNLNTNKAYFTISAAGVTFLDGHGHAEFVNLNRWLHEYASFHAIRKIPFFSQYLVRKAFTSWRRTVLHAKVSAARTRVARNLFLTHSTLQTALLTIRSSCIDNIEKQRLTNIQVGRVYQLKEFIDSQTTKVTQFRDNVVTQWMSKMQAIVETAATDCFKEKGFDTTTVQKSGIDESDVEATTKPGIKLSFTEQAARRAESARLQRFAKLADYLCVGALQTLAVESSRDVLRLVYRGCQTDVPAAVNVKAPDSSNSNNGNSLPALQISTTELVECGWDGYPQLISNILRRTMPVLELIEVREDEGFVGDAMEVDQSDTHNSIQPQQRKSSSTENITEFVPLFRIELLLQTGKGGQPLELLPGASDFLVSFDDILKMYLDCASSMQAISGTIPFLNPSNLLGGSYATTHGLEDAEFLLEGPNVSQIIGSNNYLRECGSRVRRVVTDMFTNAANWAVTWHELRQMWVDNERFIAYSELSSSTANVAGPVIDPSLIASASAEAAETGESVLIILNKHLKLGAEDTMLSPIKTFFETNLGKFASQQTRMKGMPVSGRVDNFSVGCERLKSVLLPSPERCFREVSALLPGLAKDKNELLLGELQTWVRHLGTQPHAVDAFVEYLDWLEKIQFTLPLVDVLFAEVTSLYSLMDTYRIPIEPTDLALHQSLGPTLRTLRDVVDMAVETKDDNIQRYSAELEKAMSDLMGEVAEVRNAAQDPSILTASSNTEEVTVLLNALVSRIRAIEDRKHTYESWGELFKAGGSFVALRAQQATLAAETGSKGAPPAASADGDTGRSQELDDTKTEVSLKLLLWSSIQEWKNLTEKWMTSPFDSVNTEELSNTITSYVKVVAQLDKGIPPNEVVPYLKTMVDEYRAMYPTIVDLRNPALKSRHWEKIQDALGKQLVRDETWTLSTLMDQGVFNFKDEISQVSSQASSETALEEMLARVVKAWNDCEFLIINYRDAKDVFILGSVEDVEALLEDSLVTVATVKSSRFIGPIRNEVERTDRALQLFAETLEEWLTCQRGWLYLESIFSAPDIQRQLPDEARMFTQVDRNWKETMRKTARSPNALKAGTQPGLLEQFQQNNALLDQIQKCLEDYLESKRLLFPRFYFLSNEELLEILSQTRNPLAVQPHLSKCFDAIKSLDFSSADLRSMEIIAMISPEGERIPFTKAIKARGNVEGWLGSVEEAMVAVLRKLVKNALADYSPAKRGEWVLQHAGQVVLAGNQVMWTKDTEMCARADQPQKALLGMKDLSIKNLAQLAALVRGDLNKLQRAILGALITIDVHNRDIIQGMINSKLSGPYDFEWTKQLRYLWDAEADAIQIQMSSSTFNYGYEYLGCSPRLVITPLTDRCYLTLTSALQLNLGGSPVGPAGTGKTETVKDLAKALARQCVVFNCSDSLDYKMMGKMFAGLAQSGAWCCFDEFNRIDIEVLSVIAQQLLTIKAAKDGRMSRFNFEGREIRLIDTCAAFITMNPGYAGRTELPDNLKALFRPISMMIPDYGLIAEIMLFSEGFENAKVLAGKVVNLYKLCSEQLSQQDHYDFGMRAVKSVLTMAGGLKRASPEQSEDIVLIRALRDSNLPKFLAEDVPLFSGILSDLFPGLTAPDKSSEELVQASIQALKDLNLEPTEAFVKRVCQLYETTRIRHGVMLVGPTGGGKTTCYQILQEAMTRLAKKNPNLFSDVKTSVLNPKCLSMAELYGEFNLTTMEWTDGLIGIVFREHVSDKTNAENWTVCDGPVDALWIENMNTVLDDNKLLCLANSERIKMTPMMHMLFEVADLAVASPATVSRCGMVYMDPVDLGWRPYVKTWLRKLPNIVRDDFKEFFSKLFETYMDRGLQFVRTHCKEYVRSINLNLVASVCRLIETFCARTTEIDFTQPPPANSLFTLLGHVFIFCYVWGLGGNLADGFQDAFDTFARDLFEAEPISAEVLLPANTSTLFGYFVDVKRTCFTPWDDLVAPFKYEMNIPYFQMIVPTQDTVKYSYFLETLVGNGFPVMIGGNTGVGKSVIVQDTFNRFGKDKGYGVVPVNFSAQTGSASTQQILELKLEKKRKNIMGPPTGIKKLIFFVDDVNMPRPDTYGAQPVIELLRQYLDFGGMYDREKLFWKVIQDVIVVAACAPPGGGRNQLTARFVRHFNLFNIPAPSEMSLSKIFRSIVDGFLRPFSADIRPLGEPIVNSNIEIYQRMCKELLPTPAKSHYTFNLRDLSKVIQGVLQVRPSTIHTKVEVVKLLCHETSRIFHDRLIDEADRTYFNEVLLETVEKNFSVRRDDLNIKEVLFGDFMKRGVPAEDRLYIELPESKAIGALLEEYLEDYNVTYSKEARLIFFADAQQHVARISRILRQPRGNALLVGVGGTGKQSLTRLACHTADFTCFQVELTRSYGVEEWREDLKKLYRLAGVAGKNTVFLLSDTQLKQESFLEDINAILNSGEVPNLFEFDEREKILGELRPVARDQGLPEDRDSVQRFFISRVRDNLHIVFATSPVGDTFRNRCRMFPSLVNCCTIDWFDEWPRDALLSVSRRFLEFVDVGSDEAKDKIAALCVEVHSSVGEMAKRFYAELKRKYYTTPTSYLELINLYVSMLQEKRKELGVARDRLQSGLRKLTETNELVANMQLELERLGPQLKQSALDVEVLMIKIAKDQEAADGVRRVVAEEEMIVRDKAVATQAIADEAQRDLDQAVPALESAYKALDALDKKDIAELKVFTKPPDAVMMVMEAICTLFKVKPDWDNSKKLLSDSQFMKKMMEYDKDNIPEPIMKKLGKYIANPTFTPEAVERVSKACKSLCMWVCAMELYSRVFKEVAPKRKRLEEATSALEATRAKLAEKTAALREVEDQLNQLKSTYENSVASKRILSEKAEDTTKKLTRAGKLVTALADEQTRWAASVENLTAQIEALTGNMFLGAACVAYFGAFTSSYRAELVALWIKFSQDVGINVSPSFSLLENLADPAMLREWTMSGLPSDNLSMENGILVTRGRKWPLMIDPQGQANKWIRNMAGNDLKVIKLNDPKFLRALENAVRTGQSVLMEDVGETLDPALEPLLLKQTVRQGGRLLIKLGDTQVDYDRNFKLYITTKLSNPHYLPEVCIKVTLINFTVTKVGLEGQLLADVVKLERPDLEEQRNTLIMNIVADKKQLSDIEDKILRLLFNSQGNILDDEELINTLNQSKVTSSAIMQRVKEAEQTERQINTAREEYRPVAIRGSVLYFTVADLAEIDIMYQFSLSFFKAVFCLCIKESEKQPDLQQRISVLCTNIVSTIYNSVSRGLFEQHKMIFSFSICVHICRQAGLISEVEWNFFLRGGNTVRESDLPVKPAAKWLTLTMWRNCIELSQTIPALSYLPEHINTYPVEWEGFVESDTPFRSLIPGDGSVGKPLSSFQRLLVVKVLREEKLVVSSSDFIGANLGESYIGSPPLDMVKAYKDMSAATPMVFVLSPGSDPISSLMKLASSKDFNMQDRLHMISLGQGQGPIAEELVKKASINGDWLFLQNCHLAASWMTRLEQLVKELSESSNVNGNFRLFLSSMPSRVFPATILQESVKLTNEPPKGLRSNIARSFADIPRDVFDERPPQGTIFKKLLFGLCFFSAVIHERKRFGPLGWNINYDWSESDLTVSMTILKNALAEQKNIPWAALTYLTGEITFGGRVTDEWDRRTVMSLLGKYYNLAILDDKHRFTSSGIYFAPPDGDLASFRAFIDALPFTEDPSVFGMHENANISYQMQEARRLIRTLVEVQPRLVTGGLGKSSEELVHDLANAIMQDLPSALVIEHSEELTSEEAASRIHLYLKDETGRMINPLSTVLVQESARFNRLLATVRTSLDLLMKAIKGLVVMSAELDAVFKSLLQNEVPKAWERVAYPSLKPLSSWVKDLAMRVIALRDWLNTGQPKSFWLSGVFFPQGFLTGVLQAHSRKYNLPIDSLSFTYEVMSSDGTEDTSEMDGVLVHGLYIEGGRWDANKKCIQDSFTMEMFAQMPPIRFIPTEVTKIVRDKPGIYLAPLYKTSARAGTLSTTGASTNFIIAVELPSTQPSDYWISRGVALLCQLNE